MRDALRRLARLAAFLLAAAALPAAAQVLDSVIMPGKVIEGHAKLETECSNCHKRFDKAAQSKLCLDCHKPVAADVAGGRGFHGKAPQAKGKECRTCHTEHKGRATRIAAFDEAKFDHQHTDFPLKGAHAAAKCSGCHDIGKRHAETPGECVECHRKDDTHKGSFGSKCAECHNERTWKEATFDHAKTRFGLVGKHADAKCVACHEKGYKDTPRECIACHRSDDAKAHKGRYGAKCETCHDARNWENRFPHDTKTKFPLGGKHRTAKCDSCHKGPLYAEALPTKCVSCHRADDTHKGSLGEACEKCHNDKGWKGTAFDHARDTKFPLRFKHKEAKCEACHKGGLKEKVPATCIGCHQADDTHAGKLGPKCEACHADKSWKALTFDHERDTGFELAGKHAVAKCASCHKTNPYADKTPVTCAACHGGKDDPHKGELGDRCDKCHNARGWKEMSFNHSRTKFPLAGAHVRVACDSCHKSKRYKEAPSDCAGCHAKDDVHKRTLGPKCADCHNVRTWKSWDFDHAKRTKYPLEGAHRKVPCASCHLKPTEGRVETATACVTCHRRDDAHAGSFGTVCERCHVLENWKTLRPGANRVAPPRQP
jgi:hypothetical protein